LVYPVQGDYGPAGPNLQRHCAALSQGRPAVGWTFKGAVATTTDMMQASCTIRSLEKLAPNEFRLTESCEFSGEPAIMGSRYLLRSQDGAFTETSVDAPAVAARPKAGPGVRVYAPCPR
jgi:hypothetical protein